jgi:hypothetical protein
VKQVLCVLLVLLLPSRAVAQEPIVAPPAEEFRLPEPSEILPLRRGAAAPRDGLLIDAGDMLQIQQEYDRMRYLLSRTSERDRELCDVRVEMERARLSAAEERLRLRDDLWGSREGDLLRQLRESQAQARRAAERGWWESEALWFAVGVVATGAVWAGVTVR